MLRVVIAAALLTLLAADGGNNSDGGFNDWGHLGLTGFWPSSGTGGGGGVFSDPSNASLLADPTNASILRF